MPSSGFTPGEGGGKPARPLASDPAIEEYNDRQEERADRPLRPIVSYGPVNPSPSTSQTPSGAGSQKRQKPNAKDRSNGQSVAVQTMEDLPDLAAAGFITFKEIDSNLGNQHKLPDISESLLKPNAAIEMEFYLASRHNPLLLEVMIATQQGGIPPALQGKIGRYLRYFADFGMDEEDDDEARRYLVYRMYGGPGHDHQVDPLDVAWEEALTALELSHDGIGDTRETAPHKTTLDKYEAHLESMYGVRFTEDSTDGRDTSWDLLGLRFAHIAFSEMAAALGEYVRGYGLYWDDATAFRRIIGNITMHHSSTPAPKTEYDKIKALAQVEGDRIKIYWLEDRNRSAYLIPNVILHELAHRLNANGAFGVRFKDAWMNLHEDHPRSREGMGAPADDVLIGKTVIESNASTVTLPMLYQDIGISSPDHVIFRRAKELAKQIQSLQQSPETDDSTENWYDEIGRNEVTADAILNWVKHRNSGGRFGFTSDEEGLRWLQFMDENMDDLIPNAIVHNAMETGDPTYVTEIGGFPEVFGSGTVRVADGLNVRSTPMANDENRLRSLKQGEKLLILGRSEDNKWIATAKNGVLAWVYYGGEDDRYVSLPKGVYIGDLPIYGDHATLDLDPIFR